MIYGLKGVGETDYFYVGSTKHSLKNRLYAHLYAARTFTGPNRHLLQKIRKVGVDNISIDLIEIVGSDNRIEREYYWINKLINDGVGLVNILTTPYDPAAGKDAFIKHIACHIKDDCEAERHHRLLGSRWRDWPAPKKVQLLQQLRECGHATDLAQAVIARSSA